jgi:hypothetical protein
VLRGIRGSGESWHRLRRPSHAAEREQLQGALDDAKSFPGVRCPGQGFGEDEGVFLVVRRASLMKGRGGPRAVPRPGSGVRPVTAAPLSREWLVRLRPHTVDADLRRDAVESGTLFVTDEQVLLLAPSTSFSVPFGIVDHIDRVRRGASRLVLADGHGSVTLGYGDSVKAIVESRVDLAFAHFRGDVPALVRKLEDQLARLGGEIEDEQRGDGGQS